MTLSSGTRLGPYEITAPLGAGGMGEVWRAVDSRLERPVAIKVLPGEFAADRERVARFAREAKLLASLKHPGIATIHSFEEIDGQRLLVMELAEGEGLDARIARGPMPLDEAIPIARQIAEALEQAHEQGIVHRDLKPANVKIADDGRVKLLDFGLAKAMALETLASSDVLSKSPTIEASPTVAGVILGTAPYMAPEQARGRSVDRRADIWAFGAVLWEMLTGRRLFTGDSVSDVLANVLKQPIDLAALPAATPARVRSLLERCLDRDPRARLRDAGEARIALERAGEPAAPETSSVPARGSRARLLAAVASAALLGGAAAWRLRPAPSPPPLRAVAFGVDGMSVTFMTSPAISPDGTRLAYEADNRLWVQSLADPGAAPAAIATFTGPILSRRAFWSPDGAELAIVTGHKLSRVAAGGGTVSVICEIPGSGSIIGADWGADDEIVFGVWRGDLYRVPGRGGRPETLLAHDPKTEIDFHAPRILPGKRVLFVPHRFDREPNSVEAFDGTRRVKVLEESAALGHLVTTGRHIVYDRAGREGIWEVPFSAESMKTTGPPRLALSDGTAPSVARDGTLVFVRGAAARMGELVWVDEKGDVSAGVGAPARGLGEPVLSPDGTRVAVSIRSDGSASLWTVDLARGTPARLTSARDADEVNPSWTQSGRTLLYANVQAANFLATMRALDPTRGRESRDAGLAPMTCRAVPEPDGRHLVTMTDDGSGRAAVWRVPVDPDLHPTGAATALSQAAIWWSGIAIAPRGDLVAFSELQGDQTDVVLSRLGGEERAQVSNGGGLAPRWSRDGERLFYIQGDDMMSVDVRREPSIALGAARRLFSLAERHLVTQPFDVAADRRFLMVRQSEPPRIVVVVNGARLLEGKRG